jgi:hypothetical protein
MRVARTLAAVNSARAFHFKGLVEVYGDNASLCFYCGRASQRMTRDHVMPISLGGQTTLDNLVPACTRCNALKGSRAPREWFSRHPRFAFHFMKYATAAAKELRAIAEPHAARYTVKRNLWGDAEWL